MELTQKIREVISLIPEGKENAVSMARLAYQVNLSKRDLRKAIQYARESGEIIAGDEAGYYQPITAEELRHYYNRAFARATTALNGIQAVKLKIAELEKGLITYDEKS